MKYKLWVLTVNKDGKTIKFAHIHLDEVMCRMKQFASEGISHFEIDIVEWDTGGKNEK